jgi:hypothetical protein
MHNRRKYIRAMARFLNEDEISMKSTIRLRIHFQSNSLGPRNFLGSRSIWSTGTYYFSTCTSGRNCETPYERFNFLSGVSITSSYDRRRSIQSEFSGTCFKVVCICSMFVIIVVYALLPSNGSSEKQT